MAWQLLAFVIAVAIMAAPDLLGLGESVGDAFHILAPLDAAIAAVAASTVLRGLRRLHLVLGPAIALAGILLGDGMPALAVGIAGGAMLTALAFPGGAHLRRYGGGWRAVWHPRRGAGERRDG